MTTILHKKVDLDSSNRIINIQDWAKIMLSDEEYQSFAEAQKRNSDLMKSYHDAGLIEYEPIIKEVYVPSLNESITITIGQNVKLSPGVTILDIPIDPEFGAWHARYMSDPDINYSPTIQL
jgi:hypothetical protein